MTYVCFMNNKTRVRHSGVKQLIRNLLKSLALNYGWNPISSVIWHSHLRLDKKPLHYENSVFYRNSTECNYKQIYGTVLRVLKSIFYKKYSRVKNVKFNSVAVIEDVGLKTTESYHNWVNYYEWHIINMCPFLWASEWHNINPEWKIKNFLSIVQRKVALLTRLFEYNRSSFEFRFYLIINHLNYGNSQSTIGQNS